MTRHGSKFGHKKEDAIAALRSQRNVEEAARVAGIGTEWWATQASQFVQELWPAKESR
jgi:hypothetical protein